jgi:hypothetical protein
MISYYINLNYINKVYYVKGSLGLGLLITQKYQFHH